MLEQGTAITAIQVKELSVLIFPSLQIMARAGKPFSKPMKRSKTDGMLIVDYLIYFICTITYKARMLRGYPHDPDLPLQQLLFGALAVWV